MSEAQGLVREKDCVLPQLTHCPRLLFLGSLASCVLWLDQHVLGIHGKEGDETSLWRAVTCRLRSELTPDSLVAHYPGISWVPPLNKPLATIA